MVHSAASQNISSADVSWLWLPEMSFFLWYWLVRSRRIWCVIFTPLSLQEKSSGSAWNVFFLMVLACKKQKNLVCHFHSPFFLRKIIRYIQGTFLLLQQVRDQEKLPSLSVPFINFLASSIQFFLNNFLALGVIFWELCQRCMQYWTYSISQSLQHAEKEKSNQKHHWSKTLDFIEANMYK